MSAAPSIALAPISARHLRATKGAASVGGTITSPSLRAVALSSSGDAASLSFVFRGPTPTTRALASGEVRRQLGLKLRAEDSCNVLYVMWQLAPAPLLVISLKHNPGMRTHRECGARGYTPLSPSPTAALSAIPPLSPGAAHTLHAELSAGELLAWIDARLVWRGRLLPPALVLSGPAGLRSDNVCFDLVAFSAAPPLPAG